MQVYTLNLDKQAAGSSSGIFPTFADAKEKWFTIVSRQRHALTARQREVLDLVSRGLQNKEIAERLAISENAVKKHVETLRRRYAAANRVELVRAAILNGDINLGRR